MSEKIYALLVRLYPSHFREAYGEAALPLFRDRARDEKGFFSRVRLWFGRRTLMYLAGDPDGSGPWLYSMDVEAHSNLADDRHWVLPTTGSKLSSVCLFDQHQREYLETCERSWNGIVEWSRSENFWPSGNLPRWPVYRVLSPATRADALVRDAGRWHQRTDCDRFARPAGCSRMGTRWPVDHLGGGRSRRPSPLPSTSRRSLPNSFCPAVLGRSHVGARWALRGLIGSGY